MRKIDKVIERLNVMREKRTKFEAIWDKAAMLCSVDSRIYEKDRDAKQFRQKVFDTTSRNALSYFAASLKSVLVPSTQKWHTLKPSNPELEENFEVKGYLQDIRDLLFKVRYASNSQFAYETDILLNQIGIYGFGVWYVGDDVGKGIIYRAIPVNEVFIDENEFGKVDTVYRVFKLTARQAYQKYGDMVSEEIKKRVETQPDMQFEFLHAVEPRKDVNPKSFGADRFPIQSIHMELQTKNIVKEGGYRVMPYMVPHYLKVAGSPYGDSPAMQCFPDMLTINEMQKTILRTAQLQANPPILTGNSLIDSAKLGRAGAIIRGGVDSQGRPTAVSMQYGNNLTANIELIQQVKGDIERAFLLPLFQALTQEKEMTATEVEKREMEKSMVLAPMCERISAEWLEPMIQRELDILSQYGLLDDVPDELMSAGSINIEFESPYVRMQETSQVVGLYKTIEAAATMAQTDPTVLDAFDMQKALEMIADFNDVSHKVMRSDEEIRQIGQQRAEMQNAQAMLQAGESLTKSMKNAKIDASNIDAYMQEGNQ